MNDYLLGVNFKPYFISTDIEFFWSFSKWILYEATCITIFVAISKVRDLLHTLRQEHKKSQMKDKKQRDSGIALLEVKSPAKALYESKLISKYALNINQRIFNYIHSVRKEACVPYTVFFDNCSPANDQDKANLLNKFFQFVFKSSITPPPDLEFLPVPPIFVR